ncbi:hypothetical protein C0995_006554 [Termitomyces sp. Mi166|nr:hypothetical protein C0995_006554 [Termitomyces sp. Mi166\
MATIAMDGIRNPDKARPPGECVIGEAARQFWKLSLKCASEGARRRFIEAFDEYTTSVVQQAQDRAQNHLRDIGQYLVLRRKTVGVMPSFVILQFELNLPDEFFEDPVIQRLTDACIDMIILSNDMCSYNVEQARGDNGHNIVIVVMHHENIGLNEAMRWIGDHYSKLVHNFLLDLSYVPSFGKEVQEDVDHYIYGMANWVRANDCWSFEGRRYFAANGLETQRSRKVVLLPRNSRKPYTLHHL